MSERIAFPKSAPITLAEGADAEANITPTVSYASRVTLDVAEEALRKLTPEVVPHIVAKLSERIAWEERGAVADAVHTYLLDGEWAEAAIKEAIHDIVREWFLGILKEPDHG